MLLFDRLMARGRSNIYSSLFTYKYFDWVCKLPRPLLNTFVKTCDKSR